MLNASGLSFIAASVSFLAFYCLKFTGFLQKNYNKVSPVYKMTPSNTPIIITFILVFKFKDVILDITDYWSDDFDVSRNCENKGRRHIHA